MIKKIFSRDYKYSKQVSIVFVLFYIAVPVSLVILPVDFFDHGQAVCLSVLLFHRECWGCGFTRAVMHMVHFDFDTALEYNRLAFIVLPMLAAMWLSFLIKELVYLYILNKNKR